MKNKALLISLLASVLGFFIAMQVMDQQEEDLKRKYGEEKIVFRARTDIKEMQTINDDQIEEVVVPKNFAEPGAFSVPVVKGDQEAASKILSKDRKQVVGMVATIPIRRGEQITRSKIVEPNPRSGLAAQVTPGKRAVTIGVNENTSAGRMIKPGDHVDVLVLYDNGTGKENQMIRTLLQDVPVLATGRRITNNVPREVGEDPATREVRIRNLQDVAYSNLTLEVDPVSAQVLILMSTSGSNIYLSLRHHDDSETAQNLAPLRMRDIFGDTRAPAGGGR